MRHGRIHGRHMVLDRILHHAASATDFKEIINRRGSCTRSSFRTIPRRQRVVYWAMRAVLLVLAASALFAQQPILYSRTTYNSASYAPFGLPNAAIARGSVFTIFGENLGPAQSPALSFPLSATLGGVSISVTQRGVTDLHFAGADQRRDALHSHGRPGDAAAHASDHQEQRHYHPDRRLGPGCL